MTAAIIFAAAFLQPSTDFQRIVESIRDADYRGDRETLAKEFDAAAPFLTKPELRVRTHYWRGFAMWRRAINGFNETPAPSDLEADLNRADHEFAQALRWNSRDTESKIGRLGSQGLIGYLHASDQAWLGRFYPEFIALQKSFTAEERENPRFLWVVGPGIWKSPPPQGGDEAALKLYLKGLETCRRLPKGVDPLAPTWGEPEILMNLAYTCLYMAKPDPARAEKFARSALKLVPSWHYVRRILLPQIERAKGGSAPLARTHPNLP